jgi:hypothetical protein
LTIWEALIFVAGYGGYIIVLYNWKKILPYKDKEQISDEEKAVDENFIEKRIKSMIRKITYKLNNLYIVFLLSVFLSAFPVGQ